MTDEPTPATLGDDAAEHLVEAYGAESMTDADLIAAYRRTTDETADHEANALAAEIEARGLDL